MAPVVEKNEIETMLIGPAGPAAPGTKTLGETMVGPGADPRKTPRPDMDALLTAVPPKPSAADGATDDLIIMHERPEAGRVVYHLLTPLIVNGDRLDRVTMRLPTLGEIEDLGVGTIASPGALLEQLTGVPRPVIRSLSGPDGTIILAIFRQLIGSADRVA